MEMVNKNIMANKKNNSPFQIQFWLRKINPATNLLYTEEEAKQHIRSFRKTNIEYWLNKGYSQDEAKLQLVNFQKTSAKYAQIVLKEHPEYQSIHIEYWLKKGYSYDEAVKKLSERQTTFSLQKCIERYGKDKGQKIFDERQSKWQNTLKSKPQEEIDRINKEKLCYKRFFDKRRPRDKVFWIEWKQICENSNIKFIDNIEDLKKYLIERFIKSKYAHGNNISGFLKECPLYLYKILCIKKKIIRQWLSELKNDLNSIYKITKSKFNAYHMIAKSGDILLSKNEIMFYQKLLSNKIEHFLINKQYPNSRLKFDFKIDNRYIEIAGFLNDVDYRSKILYKRQTFKNVFVLIDSNEYDDFIKNVILKNNEQKTNYYLTRPL